ncbi:unnamed protein product [Closterium sp. Naga37s-1]|nr:unnamed protein product [Closterium sp. Naga37s-1]
MARLLALDLAASVILALLCSSEAVSLVPSSSKTTAGNVTFSKPTNFQVYHVYLAFGSRWKREDYPKAGDMIEIENGGFVRSKKLPWLCKHFAVRIQVHVEKYNPGGG